MNTMIPYVVVWCLLALVVLGLALFRKFTSLREDSLIHIGPGEEKLIPKQVAVFHKLEVLDRWGQILTVVVAVSGLLLAALYLYRALSLPR
jgi:hypothetical protein